MPARPRETTASPKRMITAFWSPLGFALVEMHPKGERFVALYTHSKKYVVRWYDCKIFMSVKKFSFLVGSFFERAQKWTW
jgi:hypothetical protein